MIACSNIACRSNVPDSCCLSDVVGCGLGILHLGHHQVQKIYSNCPKTTVLNKYNHSFILPLHHSSHSLKLPSHKSSHFPNLPFHNSSYHLKMSYYHPSHSFILPSHHSSHSIQLPTHHSSRIFKILFFENPPSDH